jgi:hypothetical protein
VATGETNGTEKFCGPVVEPKLWVGVDSHASTRQNCEKAKTESSSIAWNMMLRDLSKQV